MTKEQLIQIAKAGFQYMAKEYINFEKLEIFHWCGVYRLYNKEAGFQGMLPKEDILAVFIGYDNFIQFTCGNKMFNHYAAVKEMEKLGIIKNTKTISEFVEYEITGSWWASWISWDWGQELASRYFAWKTKRKYNRYKQFK